MHADRRCEKINHFANGGPRKEGQQVLFVAMRRWTLPSATWEYPLPTNLFDPIRIQRFFIDNDSINNATLIHCIER